MRGAGCQDLWNLQEEGGGQEGVVRPIGATPGGAAGRQTRGPRSHSEAHQGGRPLGQGWPDWGPLPSPLALQESGWETLG